MQLYLVKFNEKSFIRAIISKLTNYKISSIYKLAHTNYLIIKSSVVLNSKYICDINSLTLAEQDLYAWGVSEVENSSQFIIYESQSISTLGGRQRLTTDGNILVRTFEYLAEVFGILNFTTDSFSDGGKYNTNDNACNRIIELVNSGASVIDLGVESTRPNASQIDSTMEIERLEKILPLAIDLKRHYKFEISIDTYHEDTVKWLLDKDISFINDVSGKLPATLVREITNTGKKYIAMHSLTIPPQKDCIIDLSVNPIECLNDWIRNKASIFEENKVNLNSVIFDPGIGFGKNMPQSWFIIKNLSFLQTNGLGILLGHSRKSFLNYITPDVTDLKEIATGIIAAISSKHVDYLRLHDLSILNNCHPIFHQLN